MNDFKGILRHPIPELTEHDVFDEDRRAELLKQKAEREEALIRHYGYRPDEADVWYKVALTLAEQVVPAYKAPKGRPKTDSLRVDGWACLWVTLRQTRISTDTKAFEVISEFVGADIKTVRARLVSFRKQHPENFAKIEAHFQNEIAALGEKRALEIAFGQAQPDPLDLWFEAEQIRNLQGRAPSPEFRTIAERFEFLDRRK